MSVEHQPQPTESNETAKAELAAIAKERLEELQTTPEAGAEHQEKRAEAAREVINKHEDAPEPAPVAEAAPKPTFAARLDHALNYRQTLASVQHKLRPASRAFSQVIHTPIVEKTSEALEKTVMRPSVVLGALWSALIVGSIFYFFARHYGFNLSGSEMLLALVGGALLGLLLEGVSRLLRRR
jgi:hypothetical protein